MSEFALYFPSSCQLPLLFSPFCHMSISSPVLLLILLILAVIFSHLASLIYFTFLNLLSFKICVCSCNWGQRFTRLTGSLKRMPKFRSLPLNSVSPGQPLASPSLSFHLFLSFLPFCLVSFVLSSFLIFSIKCGFPPPLPSFFARGLLLFIITSLNILQHCPFLLLPLPPEKRE